MEAKLQLIVSTLSELSEKGLWFRVPQAWIECRVFADLVSLEVTRDSNSNLTGVVPSSTNCTALLLHKGWPRNHPGVGRESPHCALCGMRSGYL